MIISLKNTTTLENGNTYEQEYRYDGVDSAELKDDKHEYALE